MQYDYSVKVLTYLSYVGVDGDISDSDVKTELSTSATPGEIDAESRLENCESAALLGEGLKSDTATEAVAYIEDNVTDMDSAKTAMKLMVRLIVALRDKVFPNLQDL